MLPLVVTASSSDQQNNAARMRARTFAALPRGAPKPRVTTHIAPPRGLSGSEVSRYIMASVTSTVLFAIPKKPGIHIQNCAPGPPTAIATATPAILPRPTVPESAVESAWKWLFVLGL